MLTRFGQCGLTNSDKSFSKMDLKIYMLEDREITADVDV